MTAIAWKRKIALFVFVCIMVAIPIIFMSWRFSHRVSKVTVIELASRPTLKGSPSSRTTNVPPGTLVRLCNSPIDLRLYSVSFFFNANVVSEVDLHTTSLDDKETRDIIDKLFASMNDATGKAGFHERLMKAFVERTSRGGGGPDEIGHIDCGNVGIDVSVHTGPDRDRVLILKVGWKD
jgi:hypothetical protein